MAAIALGACSSQPGPGVLGDDGDIEVCVGPVDVPDEALREALLEVVPQPTPPDGEEPPPDAEPVIMAELLRGVRGLSLPERGIADLSGLQCAQGLSSLGLANNEITDITPLLDLTGLTQLELSGNAIGDLRALGRLHRLTRLAVDDNGVSDLSPLANLTNLEALDVARNEVSDLSPLSGLENLAVLVLSNNAVSDVGPIAGLENLIGLELDDNTIASIAPLSELTRLRFIDLDGNELETLEPLSGAVDMQELEASRNRLTTLAGVEDMVGITRIVAQENEITTTRGVGRLTALSVLDLGDNAVASLEDVDGAVELQRLSVAVNRITDLSPITGLPELRDLDLRYNEGLSDLSVVGTLPLLAALGAGGYGQRQDLSALAGRQVFRSLAFVEGEVVDLGFFAELPTVESVNFTRTPLSAENLADLAQAGSLQSLALDGTGITDLSPLGPLTLIEVVNARDNMLSRIDVVANWEGLRNLRVSGNPLESLEGVELHEVLVEIDASETAVADLTPVVVNETFRRGDRLVINGAGLDTGDCGDIAAIEEREGVVETDLACE